MTQEEMEAAITDLQGRMPIVETDIADHQMRITAAEASIIDLQTRMTIAESEIDVLQASMVTAQAEIATLQTQANAFAQDDILRAETMNRNSRITAFLASVDPQSMIAYINNGEPIPDEIKKLGAI